MGAAGWQGRYRRVGVPGAIREVLEEIGLHVTIKRLIGIYSDPQHYSIMSYPSAEWVIHYVTLLFECECQSGQLQISDESTDIGYTNSV